MRQRFNVSEIINKTAQVKKYNPNLDIDKYICTLAMVVPVKDIADYKAGEPYLIMRLTNNRCLKVDGSIGSPLTNKDGLLRYATEDEINMFFDNLDGDVTLETLLKD